MDTMRVVAEIGTMLYRWATEHPVEAAGILWAAQALARRMRWSPRFVLWATRAVWGRTTTRFGSALATPVALLLDAVTLPGAIARGFHRRGPLKRDYVVEIVQNVLSATKAEIHERITRVEQREAARRVKMAEELEEILARKANERIDARMGQERAHFTEWCAEEIAAQMANAADPRRAIGCLPDREAMRRSANKWVDERIDARTERLRQQLTTWCAAETERLAQERTERLRQQITEWCEDEIARRLSDEEEEQNAELEERLKAVHQRFCENPIIASKPVGETQRADPMRPLFGDTPRLSLVTIERPEDAAESKRLGMALLALFGATDGKRPEGLAFDLHLDKSGEVKGVVEVTDEVAAIYRGTAYTMADAVAKVLGREPSSAILIDMKTGVRIELR